VDPCTLDLARIIWDYHQLPQEPHHADAIVALGTNDLRVATFAASLYRRGLAPLLIFSGGIAHQGDLLATGWTRPEAEVFAAAAMAEGVPAGHILLESRALNTAENIRFTRALLLDRGLRATRLLFVCKPFMQRRVRATLAVEWPEMAVSVVSQAMTLEEYFTPKLPPEKIIPILLGDLQRLWIYASKGWSAPQDFPAGVLDAYRELVRLGFTQHLLSGEAEPASSHETR
jgi:uncharacterized SAM-binding protein YcdF (DUF218 family)